MTAVRRAAGRLWDGSAVPAAVCVFAAYRAWVLARSPSPEAALLHIDTGLWAVWWAAVACGCAAVLVTPAGRSWRATLAAGAYAVAAFGTYSIDVVLTFGARGVSPAFPYLLVCVLLLYAWPRTWTARHGLR